MLDFLKKNRFDMTVMPAIALLFLAGLALAAYWPGLEGGFLFDDFHNLSDLGVNGDINNWESLRAYLTTGVSGPLGRPLTLLSFLLNDNTWPSHAPSFKMTNLLFHVWCGLLLCWVCLLLFRIHNFEEKTAQWMAVFSSACWMLHPLMVSTTLYVVQRMAQISTLFALLGILGYLHGRMLLKEKPKAAYVWMSLSLALGTLLATLGKENGALLPLLVLVIEFCMPVKARQHGPALAWSAVFLYLPSLALLAYLASMVNFSPDLWPTRPFNQVERLLSESRILFEYIFHIYFPQIEGRGLFQDGFLISKSLISPWTTLPAAVGVFGLLFSGFFFRNRWPLFSLAILFFLAGHVLESSVLGLELYFEHRNYLPAVFMFVPVSSILFLMSNKITKRLAFFLGFIFLCGLAFFTWQRSLLWSDSDKLEIYWAYSNPESPRAQNTISAHLIRNGRSEEAREWLEKSLSHLPDSALLNIQLLILKVYMKQANSEDFSRSAFRLKSQPFDAQAVKGVRALVDKVIEPSTPREYTDMTIQLIDAMWSNKKYSNISIFQRLHPYLSGKLYFAKHDPVSACRFFEKAIPLYDNVNSGLMMVAEAASAGQGECALKLLSMTEKIIDRQSGLSSGKSRESNKADAVYLRKTIEKDLFLRRSMK